jgi:cysteine desulfurase family protein
VGVLPVLAEFSFVTRRIYLDNAATSFPKPPGVLAAMVHYAEHLGASPGRGAYDESRETGRLLEACRERLRVLFGGPSSSHVIFTLNASDALNLAIHGLLRPGDHAITTCMDHNSVLRPYSELASRGVIEQTRVPCDPQTGIVDLTALKQAIRTNTRLIAVAHGSNVTGTLQPVREIGCIAKEHGVLFLVDAAQTAGHVPLDMDADHVDLIAVPGHKGLLGPLGTGMLCMRQGLERQLHTVRQGGTGSASELDVQPEFLPDKYEPGSHNAIGIIGLGESLRYILDRGMQSLWEHDRELTQAMLAQLKRELPGLTWYGPRQLHQRTGVFSLRITGFEKPQELSDTLESKFGLLTRSGIHCAPLAHKTIGTYSAGGTTRFSFGPYNTLEDVQAVGDALESICKVRA